jgi:hypothetical protein
MDDCEDFFNVKNNESSSTSKDSDGEDTEDGSNDYGKDRIILSQSSKTPRKEDIDDDESNYDDSKPIPKTDYDLYSHLNNTPRTPSLDASDTEMEVYITKLKKKKKTTLIISSKAPKYTMAELYPDKKDDDDRKRKTDKEMRRENKIQKKSHSIKESSKKKKKSSSKEKHTKKEKKSIKRKENSTKEKKRHHPKEDVVIKQKKPLSQSIKRKRSKSNTDSGNLQKKRKIKSYNFVDDKEEKLVTYNDIIITKNEKQYFEPNHFNIIFETVYSNLIEPTDITNLFVMKRLSRTFNTKILLSQNCLYYTIRALEFRENEKLRSLTKISYKDGKILKFIDKVKKIIGERKKSSRDIKCLHCVQWSSEINRKKGYEINRKKGECPCRDKNMLFIKWIYIKKDLSEDVLKYLNDAVRVILFFSLKWPACKIQKLTAERKKYNCLLLRYYDDVTKKESFKSIINLINHLPNQKLDLYTMQWSQNSEFIHSWGNTDKILYAMNFANISREKYAEILKKMLEYHNISKMKKLDWVHPRLY